MPTSIKKIIRPSPLQLGMICGLLLALLWIAIDTKAETIGEINTTANNIAVESYDSVAYFTQ